MDKKLNFFLLFFSFLIIYWLGSFSKIPFGDCVGFVLTIEKGNFVLETRSTAHFLYVNSCILINKIFNLGGIESTRILSIVSGAMVVALVFFLIFEITANKVVSNAGAILFGLGFSFWRNAEIPEVYSYNALFVAIYLLFSTKFFIKKEGRFLIIAGIFLGISMWEHIQNIMLIPAYLFTIFLFRKSSAVWISLTLFITIFGGLFVQPILDETPIKFVFKSGSWIEKSMEKSLTQYLGNIVKAIGYLIYNFWHFVIFGIIGIFKIVREKPSFSIFLLASGLPIFGFATFYEVSDNYVFFIDSYLIFAVFCAIGLKIFDRKKYFRTLATSALLIPLFYLISYLIIGKTPQGKDFAEFKRYKGGLSYYLLPWMKNNVGIIEFTIDKGTAPEEMSWMTESAEEYIKLMLSKGYSIEQIKEM